MKVLEASIIIIYLLIYTFFFPRLVLKQDVKSLKLLIVEIVLQNIMSVIAADLFGSRISQMIIIYKEAVIYLAILLFLLKNRGELKKLDYPMLFLIVLCFPYFFLGSATTYTKLICFRQIITPIILVLYGRTFRLKENEMFDVIKFIINIGVFQAVFGFLERFILGDALWISLNINKYMNAKGFSAWLYNNNLPGNYYTADLYNYIGMVRRLVGISTDPLLTGHFLAFCVTILLFCEKPFSKKVQRYFYLLICTVAILLTFSKGAMLIIAIAFIYKLWKKNKSLSIILGLVTLGGILYLIKGDFLYTMSRHISGLTSSLSMEYVIGNGLGSAGNYANLYGKSSSTTGESFLGAIIGQIGFFGLFVFLYSFMYILKKVKNIFSSYFSFAIYSFVVAILIESFLSESAISYVGSGIPFILLGILTTLTHSECLSINSSKKGISTNEILCE